jgi:hypothetical protein
MAYDSARARGTLYGGLAGDGSGALDDTWLWDGVSWSPTVATGPLRRQRCALAYDAARERVVLFGGLAEPAPIEGYTFEWDGSAWAVAATTGPGEREGAAMGYDAARGRTVLFGGTDSAPPYGLLGDTWEWDGAAWTLVAVSGPTPRTGHALAYDPALQRIVLFGGDAGVVLGDTWAWDGSAWSLVTDAPSDPPARRDSAMAYDPGLGELVLYGGNDGSATGHRDDTWRLAGAAWTQIPVLGPGARAQHSMCFDEGTGRLTVFGGEEAAGPQLETVSEIHTLATSPIVTTDPSSQHAPAGATVLLHVTANGFGSISYQWRRYGVPLSDGPAPGGGTLSGATSATLTIEPVGSADTGLYDVVVTNGCGSDTSDPAKLVVTPHFHARKNP